MNAPQQHQPVASDHLVTGDIYDLLAIGEDGQPAVDQAGDFPDASTEWVRIGCCRFEVLDADASALAQAAGLIDGDDFELCLRVRFVVDDGQQVPALGNIIAVTAGEGDQAGINFLVGWDHESTQAQLPAGFEHFASDGAERNEALFMLGAGEALLVRQAGDHARARDSFAVA
jgi:hypothetical protein